MCMVFYCSLNGWFELIIRDNEAIDNLTRGLLIILQQHTCLVYRGDIISDIVPDNLSYVCFITLILYLFLFFSEQMEVLTARLEGPQGPPGAGFPGAPGEPGPQGSQGKYSKIILVSKFAMLWFSFWRFVRLIFGRGRMHIMC